jgi:hypothetical protein
MVIGVIDKVDSGEQRYLGVSQFTDSARLPVELRFALWRQPLKSHNKPSAAQG